MTLARFAWRQVWRGAAIWSAVIALVLSAGISTYETAYKAPAARAALAASVGRMPTFQALYGKAWAVDTLGGFLAWRYGDLMTLLVAIWALLTVSRVLRGDEETGRAESLLAGRASPRRVVVTELAVTAAGCGLIALAVALACLAGGLPVGGSALFGAMVGLGGIVFGAVAALTSQLFDARRRAAGWAGALLGGSYLVRALADGSPRLGWLGWATPLGWTERIRPFTGGNPAPLLLSLGVALALGSAAVWLRDRRDTGAGLVPERAGRDRGRPLGSALALDWRLSTGALVAWGVGMLVGLFVLGYLAKDVVTFAKDNPTIDDMMRGIYGFSLTSATGFVGISFTVVAMLLAVYAGTHLLNAREEESASRADHVLVGGATRAGWLGARLAVATCAVLVLAFLSAVGVWLGVLAGGATLSFLDALRGSFNVVPAAVLFGGLAVAAFGLAPRATAYVAFGTVTVSYVIEVLGGLSDAPSWLLDCSPFTHIAPVPARPVDVTATLVMIAIGLAAAGVGLAAFARRDIASD